jgi:hypothetical protein
VSLSFRFHVPTTCWLEKSSPGAPTRLRIGGLVTTESKDQQTDRLLADGMDFARFEKSGYFNDNHGKSTSDVVGYPDVGVKRVHRGDLLPDGSGRRAPSEGWWAEGVLVGKKGRDIHRIARELKGSGRSLGFSVEGKILKRSALDKTVVTKALVRNIAVTHCPVNTETELNLLAKALFAGSAITNPGAAGGNGFALRGESLDGETKIATFASPFSRKKNRETGLDEEDGIGTLIDHFPAMTKSQARAGYHFAAELKRSGYFSEAVR